MKSNRISYPSCLLYVSDFDFSKAAQTVFEIPRVQSASIGLDYTLVEDKQIGYSQTNNNFSESKVSLDFSCLLSNFNFFDKFGISQIGELGAHYFFENFSGINNQQNFYILTVDENENVIQNKVFSEDNDCYVTSVTECVFDSLDIDINVSELVKTSFALDGLNAQLSLGNSGNNFELSDGKTVYCNLPSGSGIYQAEMAFSANNILLSLSENEYTNLDTNSCHVQSVKASFDLNRSDTKEIGSSLKRERNIKYPVKCKLDITAIPKNKSEFSVLDEFDSFKTNNLNLQLYNEKNSRIMSLYFDNLYLTSSKNSVSVGNNPESVDLSFYCNLGAPIFPSDSEKNSRFYIAYDKIIDGGNSSTVITNPPSQPTGFYYSLDGQTILLVQPEREELYDSSSSSRTLTENGSYLTISNNETWGTPYHKLTCNPPANGSSFYGSFSCSNLVFPQIKKEDFCIDFIMKANGNFRSNENGPAYTPLSHFGCNVIRSFTSPIKGDWAIQFLTDSNGFIDGMSFQWYTSDWKCIYFEFPLWTMVNSYPVHFAVARENGILNLYVDNVIMKKGVVEDELLNSSNLQIFAANADLYAFRIVKGDSLYHGSLSSFVDYCLPFKTY